jgi:hypothetical protein
MDAVAQAEKVAKIKCLDELSGFEAAAKARGILPEEVRALHQRRTELTPKKRRRK